MPTRFPLGHILATRGALEAIASAGQVPQDFINRHHAGDWGDLDEEDRCENDRSLRHNCRLLSAYTLSDGIKIWVITEADRSSTTILLPEEY